MSVTVKAVPCVNICLVAVQAAWAGLQRQEAQVCAATQHPQQESHLASQLQAKFEHLKRVHQEEKLRLEEKRRLLEEEIMAFSKKKATSEIYQNQTFMTPGSNLRKDKDRKK